MTILAFLFVIAICVISHEWGHYITARLFGVQVHEFAFGMGPVLCSRKRWNTLWTFRIFPVGGFVRLAGMGEERDNEELLPGGGFFEKSAWQRFLILSAGAALNILLAVGITAFLLMTRGVMDLKSTTIGEIMTEYPAAEAGLRQGDTILAVNDEPTTSWEFMAKALREAGHQGTVRILVERGSDRFIVETALRKDPQSGAFLFGIRPRIITYPFFEALGRSFGYIFEMSRDILSGILSWLFGKQKMDVTGPVGIATMAGEAVKQGLWSFLSFLAVINLNLGILNLLPFPALDGGRLIFLLGEMLTGRKFPERWEYYVHLAGFVVLISLILLVTWKDIVTLVGSQ